MVTFEVRKPEPMELCELHHTNNPEKICYLRPDMLGYILNMANLNHESRVLLVDNTRGLVAGAVLGRGVTACQIVEFHQDQTIKYKMEHFLQMDITANQHKPLSTISSHLLI
mgnify:CR=1 FL=1